MVRLRSFVPALLAAGLFAVPAAARTIPFDRLVDARMAVEEVRQELRSGSPAPLAHSRATFERLVAREQEERRWLRERRGREVSREELQRELDRITRQTRRPDELRNLFGCLGNDAALIAETIVRPLLVSAEVRRRLPGPTGQLDAWLAANPAPQPATVRGEEGLVVTAITTDGSFEPDSWLLREAESPTSRYDHTAVWTGSEMIIWGGKQASGVSVETGSRYDPTTDSWSSTRLDTTTPSARSYHTAVWTGSEMVIWGGVPNNAQYSGDGARYDPVTDSWRPVRDDPAPLTSTSSPRARYAHTAVWTGSEMIVWGGVGCQDDLTPTCSMGVLGDGASWDPATDSWKATGSTGAAAARRDHSAIFTGDRMIVWGGYGVGGNYLNTGGTLRFDGAAGDWRTWAATLLPPAPLFGRERHRAVWTGTQMIVWGGFGCSDAGCTVTGYQANGMRYDPLSNSWSPMAAAPGGVSGRTHFAAVWTGSAMIVHGGQTAAGEAGNGGIYTPSNNAWVAIADPGFGGSARGHATGVWSGSELIVWGGCQSCGTPATFSTLGTGLRFDWLAPAVSAWTATKDDSSTPKDRCGATATWTGSEMIVAFGESITSGKPLTDGNLVGRYDPLFDAWLPAAEPGGAWASKVGHTAVWTGSRLLLWGGYDTNRTYDGTLAAYDPVADSWTSSIAVGTPAGRDGHTAVWDPAGNRMIVWGGRRCLGGAPPLPGPCTNFSFLDDGGVYDPSGAGSWSPTQTTGAPLGRDEHVAVWDPATSRMIVWGGRSCSLGCPAFTYYDSGGVYDPAGSGSWSATSTTGAPTGRQNTTAIWDANSGRMVVWGGKTCIDAISCIGSIAVGDGGRYDPTGSGSWSPTNPTGAPSARAAHTAVWNGYEMMVWGGVQGSGAGDGALYDPSTDSWRSMAGSIETPSKRDDHVAVWTGREMIVWGGRSTSSRTGGLYFPDTPPTAAPTIDGLATRTVELGGALDTVNLGHSLTTAWWDDVEAGALWTPDSSDWRRVFAQNCSGLGDYVSPVHAWRFGSTQACNYSGATSPSPVWLTLTTSVAVAAEARLEFRTVLELARAVEAGHQDLAQVDVSTDGISWTTVAVNEGGSALHPSAVPMADRRLAWRGVSIPLGNYVALPAATLHVRFGLQRSAASPDGPRGVTLGWLLDDIGIGNPSGDGSLPAGTLRAADGSAATVPIAAHDAWDRASFAWHLDSDGVPDNANPATPSMTLSEADLADFGLDTPGSHLLTLEVTDRADALASDTVELVVVDGIPPAVTLLSPNGGEAWPAGSTQTITWNASDNDLLSGFELRHLVDELLLPTVSLPSTPADLADTDYFFDVPTPFTVRDVSLDVEIDWPIAEPSLTVALTNCNPDCDTGTTVLLQDGASPLSNVASISGNWDRSLATDEPLSTFDGQTSGSRWRLRFTDANAGNPATVRRLRLILTSSDTLIASIADGAARSASWSPLPSTPTTRNRVKVIARDSRSPVPNSTSDDSDATFQIISANTDEIRTLVAWNRSRIESLFGTSQADALEAALMTFVGHVKIDGVLVDTSSGAGIPALYATWDGTAWNDASSADAAQNVADANALASAIRTWIFGLATDTYSHLETVVLVGPDAAIPFFRFDDSTSRYPEANYVGELQADGFLGGVANVDFCDETRSPLLAATCQNRYVSDAPYGASTTTAVAGSALTWYLPDVAVGRLVETPDQIIDLIDTYVTRDGVTVVDEALTTGYDFLTDGGDAVEEMLSTTLDGGATTITRLSEAVSSWTDDDLRNRLFGLSGNPTSDLTVISGHANHRAEGAAAAGGAGVLTSVEMNEGTGASDGGIVLGLGCHSGLSITDDGGPGDDASADFQLDLPELFAKKRFPVFVGNGGFGWGLQDGVGLGELLLLLTTQELVDAGQLAVGEALRLARQEYFLRQDRLDAFDHKVLHEPILYGIPNYEARVIRAVADRGDRGAATSSTGAKPSLGDPSWSELDLGGGRRIRKSEPRALPVPAPADASPTADPASLRVLEFEYQAYQAGQNTDDNPPVAAVAWTPSTVYPLLGTALPGTSNGFFYRATVAGTSGATEPAWPTVDGATIVDGSVTWTAVATTDDWEEAYRRHASTSGESGTWFSLDGLATDNPGMPIQPMISFDSKLFGTKLHGVIVRGGEFVQPAEINPLDAANCTDESSVVHRCFDPAIGNPVTQVEYPEGPAPTPFVTFARPTPFVTFARPTPSGFDQASLDGNSSGSRFDTLNSPMGETIRRGVREPTPGDRQEIFAEWLYRTRQFTQYYSTSNDWTAPVIGAVSGDCSTEEAGNDCYSSLAGLTVTFDVPVTEETTPPGIFKVFVTWHSDVDSTFEGEWQSLELSPTGGGRWGGTLDVIRSTTYFVQAVDWSGNVGMVMVTGNDLDADGDPIGSQYSLPRLWTVEVADDDGDGLPDYWENQYPGLADDDADSDGDGIADGADDLDHDGVSNVRELELGWNPSDADIDDDGDNDGSELNNGKNPRAPGDGERLTLAVTPSGIDDVQVHWPRGTTTGAAGGIPCAPITGIGCLEVGTNDSIDGYFRVYVSDDPRFSTDDFRKGPDDVAGGGDDLDTFDQRNHVVTEAELPAALQSAPTLYYQVLNWDIDAPAPDIEYVSRAGNRFTIFGQFFDPTGAEPLLCASAVSCSTSLAMTIVPPSSTNRTANRILADAPGATPAGTWYVGVRNPDGLIDIDATARVFP